MSGSFPPWLVKKVDERPEMDDTIDLINRLFMDLYRGTVLYESKTTDLKERVVVNNIGTTITEKYIYTETPDIAGTTSNTFTLDDDNTYGNVDLIFGATVNKHLRHTGSEFQFNDDLNMVNNKITTLAEPTGIQDAVTKNYADTQIEEIKRYAFMVS